MKMHPLVLLLSFVTLISFTCSAVGKTTLHYKLPERDTTAIRDTTHVRHYLTLADEKKNAGQADSADYYYILATTLAKQLNNYSYEMRAMEEHMRFLHRQLKFNDALAICEQLLTKATQADDKPRLANTLNNMGVLNLAMGNPSSAAENYIKALELTEKNGYNKNLSKFHTNLASVFIDLNDKEKALYYSRKGYALALETKDSAQISTSLVNLSCSEILNELYDDAIKHLQEIISISSRLGNTERILDGYINLGEVFIRKKQYNDALHIFLEANRALEPSIPPDYALYIYHGLSVSYFHLDDLKKAQYYYKKLYPHIEYSFPKNELKDIYLFGADVHEKLGALEDALSLRKKHGALKDSLFDATTKSSIHELELKYQNTLTKKAVTEQQLVIAKQENELERKNKLIILVVAIILILITLGIIALIMYRIRQRAIKNERQFQLLHAQLIGEEKERARQAKELHDGVSGLLSAAKMHLAVINTPATPGDNKGHYEKVMALLNQVNKEVRNISHNLAPEIILQQGLQHAIADFSARINHPHLKIQYSTVGEIPRMKPEFELLIYRAIQESMNNIIKHARATTVLLQLTCLNALMTVTVEDNGAGFDMHKVPFSGLGISNLRSRIQAMNGLFDITSSPGNGTTVYMEIDISKHIISANDVLTQASTLSSLSA